jgi:hypothetical protein
VINTRPDCAFDVSWLASKGTGATGQDVSFGNKILRKLKSEPVQLRYIRIADSLDDWRFVTFHDAGWATRVSLHSQAGGAFFAVNPKVLQGEMGSAVLIDWMCSKIDRVVRSSFEAEINSAQLALDHMEYLHAMFVMARTGCTAREYQKDSKRKDGVLVGDNKGLYTAVHAANPITTKGEKRLTIDKMIMKDHLRDHQVTYRWTNAGHQLADGFTKLSVSGARSDLLLEALQSSQIRIHYSTVSGRREAKELQEKADIQEGFLALSTFESTDLQRGQEACKPQALSTPQQFNLDDDGPTVALEPEQEVDVADEHSVSVLDSLNLWWQTRW